MVERITVTVFVPIASKGMLSVAATATRLLSPRSSIVTVLFVPAIPTVERAPMASKSVFWLPENVQPHSRIWTVLSEARFAARASTP